MAKGSGKYRHRIQLEKPTTIKNSSGEPIKTWQIVGNRWAGVNPMRSRERFAAQQVNEELTDKVFMRFDSKIDSTYRIIFRNRTLNIDSIINVEERNRELEIICKEEK